ncbi:MAG: hypothetical protein O7F70_10530, partial [Gemmatimonadetes bacterium]|nr:hypothetical protein [Gemmatimonadota bacterium]
AADDDDLVALGIGPSSPDDIGRFGFGSHDRLKSFCYNKLCDLCCVGIDVAYQTIKTPEA